MAATKKRNTLIAIIGAFVLLACAPQGEESVPRTSLTLDEVTVGELQEMMQAGDLSSVQLVDYYIDRIAQLDPQLNSILEINPTFTRSHGPSMRNVSAARFDRRSTAYRYC